jgi:hypothetical protein
MQRKIVIDTGVYTDLFNKGLYREIINPFQHVSYLAHPVLHELRTISYSLPCCLCNIGGKFVPSYTNSDGISEPGGLDL